MSTPSIDAAPASIDSTLHGSTRRWTRLLLATVPAALLLVPMLAFPLGPDQGIFFVSAQKILAGAAHYNGIVDIKPPLIYHLYATAIALFGNAEWSIRLLDLMLQIATCWVIAALCMRSSRSLLAPLVGTISYAVLYIGLGSQATAQTESYVGLLGLGAWMLIATKRSTGRYFLAGMLCGVLFLLKYTLAAMLGVLLLSELLLYRPGIPVLIRHGLAHVAGFATIAALLPLYLAVFDAWQGYAEIQQFLNGYVLLQVRSPRLALEALVTEMAHMLAINYSLLLLLCSAAGIAISLRPSSGDGGDERVNERTRMLRFCVIGLLLMSITIVVEGKYFAYQFLRIYPFGVILAAYGVDLLPGRSTGFSWRRVAPLAPVVAFAFMLSPLPHYLWQSMPFVLQVTKGSAAVDAYYSRDTMMFGRIQLKTVGGYVHERLKPGEQIIVLSSTAGLVYYHARYIPDVSVYHSSFLLAPFAPERWRTMIGRFIVEHRPRFIMVEHGDTNRSQTSTNGTSIDLFRILPGVDTVVSREYHSVLRSGSYEVLERTTPVRQVPAMPHRSAPETPSAGGSPGTFPPKRTHGSSGR